MRAGRRSAGAFRHRVLFIGHPNRPLRLPRSPKLGACACFDGHPSVCAWKFDFTRPERGGCVLGARGGGVGPAKSRALDEILRTGGRLIGGRCRLLAGRLQKSHLLQGWNPIGAPGHVGDPPQLPRISYSSAVRVPFTINRVRSVHPLAKSRKWSTET